MGKCQSFKGELTDIPFLILEPLCTVFDRLRIRGKATDSRLQKPLVYAKMIRKGGFLASSPLNLRNGKEMKQ